jgi:hypothetical protein
MGKKNNNINSTGGTSVNEVNFLLKNGNIYETVATVYTREKKIHASPIGIKPINKGEKQSNGQSFQFKIYHPSKLRDHLIFKKSCVFHFPNYHQREYFLLGFKKSNLKILENLISSSNITDAKHIDAPVLNRIQNYIEVKLGTYEDFETKDEFGNSKYSLFTVNEVYSNIGDPNGIPITRAHGIFLEILVSISRLYLYEKDVKMLESNKKYINKMYLILLKLSPGAPETKYIGELVAKYL